MVCFGSYVLGVSEPGGDIDSIVIAPNYIDWEKHFFGYFYEIIEEFSKQNQNIKNL